MQTVDLFDACMCDRASTITSNIVYAFVSQPALFMQTVDLVDACMCDRASTITSNIVYAFVSQPGTAWSAGQKNIRGAYFSFFTMHASRQTHAIT